VFGGNLIHCRVGFSMNFKFKQARSSASLPSLFGACLLQLCCCSLLPHALPAAARPHVTTCHSCCRCMRAHVSTQVPGNTQARSCHLSAYAPSRHNWPQHVVPLPCTCLRQAIECVASPSRSCFTCHFRMHTFCPPTRDFAATATAAELTQPPPHHYATPEQPLMRTCLSRIQPHPHGVILRHLLNMVNSFLYSSTNYFENRLLPNDFIIVRNHVDDEEDEWGFKNALERQ
jgi:hypothetical protein